MSRAGARARREARAAQCERGVHEIYGPELHLLDQGFSAPCRRCHKVLIPAEKAADVCWVRCDECRLKQDSLAAECPVCGCCVGTYAGALL